MPDSSMLGQGMIVILLWSSVVATVGYALLRLMDRWFRHQVDPRVMHVLWLLLAIRMLLPFRAPDWFVFGLTPSWLTVVLSVWASGFLVTLFHRIRQGYYLRREILHYEVSLPEWLHRDFIEMRKTMRIKTRPVLAVTKSQHGPLLCGILRPLIAFPLLLIQELNKKSAEKEASVGAVDYILRHELCHLSGGDLWLSWLWVVARSVHWFNPLLAGAGKSLHLWRELSCDFRTLRSFRRDDPTRRARDQIGYARVLLDAATLSSNAFCPVEAAASVVEPSTEIERRITMITSSPRSFIQRLTANSTVLVVIVVLLSLSCPGLWSARAAAVAATEKVPSATEDRVADANHTEKNVTAFDSGASTKLKDEVILSCVDNTNESKRSLGASGHAVLFENRPSEGKYLEAIALFCSRYGLPQAPRDDFYLYVMKEKEQKDPMDLSAENLMTIAKIPVPYSKVKRTSPLSWYKFPTPSIELPEGRFLIAAAFNPHQTKGIYLGLDEDATKDNCKSFTGLPQEGYSPFKGPGQWMISAKLSPEPIKGRKPIRLTDAKPAYEPDKMEDSKYKIVSYCGTKSDGKQSYGGAGPVLTIPMKGQLAQCKLAGISLWASRYGSGFNPKTKKIDVVLTDADGETLYKKSFPYSKFSYTPRTVNLVFPKPLELKSYIQEDGNLYIGIDPKAHQRKGIYFHYTKNESGRSHSGVLTPEIEISPTDDREWMIQSFFLPPEEDEK